MNNHDNSTKDDSSHSNTVLLIAGGVVVAFSVCLIGLIIFVVKKRKSKTKRKVPEKNPEGKYLSMSIYMEALKMYKYNVSIVFFIYSFFLIRET